MSMEFSAQSPRPSLLTSSNNSITADSAQLIMKLERTLGHLMTHEFDNYMTLYYDWTKSHDILCDNGLLIRHRHSVRTHALVTARNLSWPAVERKGNEHKHDRGVVKTYTFYG